MAKGLQAFQDATHMWQQATFKNSTVASKMKHLEKETREIAENPGDIMEYADAMMLLIGALALSGFTADNLMDACWRKLAINQGRDWGEPDADGVVEHIREGKEPK